MGVDPAAECPQAGLETSTRPQHHPHWTPDLMRPVTFSLRDAFLSDHSRASELLQSEAGVTWVHLAPWSRAQSNCATLSAAPQPGCIPPSLPDFLPPALPTTLHTSHLAPCTHSPPGGAPTPVRAAGSLLSLLRLSTETAWQVEGTQIFGKYANLWFFLLFS